MLQKHRFLIPLVGCLLISAAGQLSRAAESATPAWQLALPTGWRVQPAETPDTPPNPADWGSTPSADWRGGGVQGTGTSWAKKPHKDVNSLWYEQNVTVPAAWQGRRVIADFERLEGDAIVFCNGARIGERLRPGGEIELTPHLRCGQENLLRIFITRNYTGISRGFEQDLLRYIARTNEWGEIPMDRWAMGITAPVRLYARHPDAGLTDLWAIPSWRNRTLTLEFDLNPTTPQKGLELSAVVQDAAGHDVLRWSESKDVAAGRGTVRLTQSWKDPKPWELDAGVLYTAQVQVSRGGVLLDEAVPIRFGFREIWTEGRQLMMNGHPLRLRMGLCASLTANSLPFFRLLGFNASYIQNNPTAWWRDWSETPGRNEETLAVADETGFAVSMLAPSVSYIRQHLTEPAVRAAYENEMRFWVRGLRNHPSILFWTVGMNAWNPREAVHAPGVGQRAAATQGMPLYITTACNIAKAADPTRLVYSHADGGLGDICSSNSYLNFVPLQEREEWLSAWARTGNMPHMMVEWGPPYGANFWKGTRFLGTEYSAIYFGDNAYRREPEASLRRVAEIGQTNKSGHGGEIDEAEAPAVLDLMELFTKNTNRSFRTYGFGGGWYNWDFSGYGDPPGLDKSRGGYVYNRYAALKEPVTTRPPWTNRRFDIYSQDYQPLLAWLAGAPAHTDKTHAYFAGERIAKQIAIVWDGQPRRRFQALWSLRDAGGRVLADGKQKISVDADAIVLKPVDFRAPAVAERTACTLSLQLNEDGREVAKDTLALQIFPKPVPVQLAGVSLWDPKKRSAPGLARLGVQARTWSPGEALAGTKLLIIGREALAPGQAMPCKAADIAAGLNVLVLEQSFDVWKAGFGFHVTTAMSRYVFARDKASPALTGIAPEDLLNWRGAPDLMPEGKNPPSDVRHAPKWTNTHAVASLGLDIPQVAGFTPLLAAEFDLASSPLLEWRHGRGRVIFSTLDFTDRLGTDPAATRLAGNLLTHAATPAPATRRVVYAGNDAGHALVTRLCGPADSALVDAPPATTLLVLGDEAPDFTRDRLAAFIKAGGHVLSLPKSADALAKLGFKTEAQTQSRVPETEHPLFHAVGPNLLRWREPANVTLFTDSGQPAGVQVVAGGAAAVWSEGTGAALFLQVGPDMFASSPAAPADKSRTENLQLSRIRLSQLTAQLLTNLGAPVPAALAERLMILDMGPAFELLSSWNVLGPFFVDKEDGELMLNTRFPGEETAIAGDDNPNTVFTTPDGRRLDWRWTVTADENGTFIDIGKALKRSELTVAYVMRRFTSESDREAVLRFGADWRAMIWVNGEPVFRTLAGGNNPLAHQVKIKLRRGENVIAMKIGSGSKGFGFYASLSLPSAAGVALPPELKKSSPYFLEEGFDPYQYFYW